MDTPSTENLIAYSIQIALLLGAGGIGLRLIRVAPIWRLLCWQFLLSACLLLPFVETWKAADDSGSVQFTSRIRGRRDAPTGDNGTSIPWAQIGGGVLIAGSLLRLSRFGLGLARLRAYRQRSMPGSSQERFGVKAEVRTSDEIPGPVTFGFFRPIVLLPAAWHESEPVLIHELIHVRRGDWLFMASEELLRAILWFHPLVWYAISQIQLAREEVVDHEVVRLTQSREQYLETLLAIAAAKSGLDLAPAPLFLRKRHLRKRVASLMKEVRMSKFRLNTSLAGFLALTLATGWVAVRAFPLQAASADANVQDEQSTPKRIRVGGNKQSENLIRKVTPAYPVSAKKNRIQGQVRMEAVIAADGTVKSLELVSGDPELTDAAMTAVRQWIYRPTLLNGDPVEVTTQIDVNFTLTK